MAKEKILIIEDSVELISFLAEGVLAYHGYPVVTARTVQEGLRKLSSEEPDLLLLDLELPDSSGMEVLKAMQEQGSSIPVIMMTAYGSESIAVEAFRWGAKDYLIKPFTSEKVVDALERTLTETRLRREKDLLTRTLQQKLEELTVLSAVGKSVVSLMGLEELLNRIVEAAVYITKAEEGFLLLVDPEEKDLRLRAGKNLGEDHAQGFKVRVADSLAGEVLKKKEPVVLRGKGAGRDFKVKTGYLVKSLLLVPLLLRDEAVGVLSVDNQVSDREFTADDASLLSSLADYAAVSIDNATLYERLRKNMETLKRSQQELIESSKLAAVGTLAAGIAHEFNNLLAGISGHAQLALLSEDRKETEQGLEVIVDSVDRAKRITTNLLTFARRHEPRMESASIAEAVENPLLLMEKELEKSNIKLVRRFSEVRRTVCDSAQISQVCLNLLTNARDSMLPEGGTLTVEVKGDEDDIVIAFSDTGCGVPEHVLDKLFEPFVTTKGALGGGQMRGTGLGLSVSYGIVQNHGGTIEVETEAGKGSTFSVRLPVRDE